MGKDSEEIKKIMIRGYEEYRKADEKSWRKECKPIKSEKDKQKHL